MKSIVSKPWGSFELLEEKSNYVAKRLIVNSGGILSLQSHMHRSEHWITVQGVAEVTIDKKITTLDLNKSIFVPKGSVHRISNKRQETLIIIEIWYGDNLDEGDIIRYDDIYNRK